MKIQSMFQKDIDRPINGVVTVVNVAVIGFLA